MTKAEFADFPAGDHGVFHVLYRRLQPALTAYVAGFIRDQDERDDVLQDIWLRIFTRRASYRSNNSFQGWAFTIARNVCLMRRRAAARSRMVHKPDGYADTCAAEPPPGPEKAEDDQRTAAQTLMVLQALSALPECERAVTRLRWIHGRSLADIAADLGIAIGTVKATLYHARSHLRASLQVEEARRTQPQAARSHLAVPGNSRRPGKLCRSRPPAQHMMMKV